MRVNSSDFGGLADEHWRPRSPTPSQAEEVAAFQAAIKTARASAPSPSVPTPPPIAVRRERPRTDAYIPWPEAAAAPAAEPHLPKGAVRNHPGITQLTGAGGMPMHHSRVAIGTTLTRPSFASKLWAGAQRLFAALTEIAPHGRG